MLPWIFRPSNWKLSFRILPTALALVIHTVCIDCIFAMSCAEPIIYPIIVHQMLYVSGSGINTNFRHQFKNRMEIDAIHFPMIIDVWREFDAKKFKNTCKLILEYFTNCYQKFPKKFNLFKNPVFKILCFYEL